MNKLERLARNIAAQAGLPDEDFQYMFAYLGSLTDEEIDLQIEACCEEETPLSEVEILRTKIAAMESALVLRDQQLKNREASLAAAGAALNDAESALAWAMLEATRVVTPLASARDRVLEAMKRR